MNINKLFRHFSIKSKLTIAFLAIAVIPLIFVGIYNFHLSATTLKARVLKQLEFQVGSKAREITSFLDNVEYDLMYLSNSATLKRLINFDTPKGTEWEKFRQMVEGEFLLFSQGKRVYYQLRYIDNNGKEMVRINYDRAKPYSVPKMELQDKSKRYYFREAMKLIPGQIYISPMDLNIEHGKIEQLPKPVVRYGTPIANAKGQKKGIVVINIFARYLFELIRGLPPEGVTFLLDKEGFYLYYSSPGEDRNYKFTSKRNISADYPSDIAQHFLSRQSGAFADNSGGIIAFAPIKIGSQGSKDFWMLGVSSPKELIASPVNRLLTFMALLVTSVIIIAGLIGILSARHFSRPILALCDGTKVIAEGNFEHRIQVDTNDELEDLALNFNNMAKRVGDSVKKLEGWNEELQREVEIRTRELKDSEERARLETRKLDDIVSSVGAELSLINPKREIIWANKILAQQHGGLENLIGKKCHEVYWYKGEPCPDCLALQTFKDGTSKTKIMVNGEDPESSSYFHVVTTPVKNEKGKVFQVLKLSLDITDSVMRERQTRREVAQAEKLAALGQLATGIIHEVANPLAAIKTTIQIMERDLAQKRFNPEPLKEIVKEIDSLANFLNTFFSFAKPKKPDWKICDIREVLEGVLLLVEKDAEKRGIRLVKDLDEAIPEIEMDSYQIQQVYLNLILNAFEATPPGGQINISIRQNPEYLPTEYIEIAFVDTGSGITKEDMERIFDPFFTTKPTGTGLGLSIVFQIIKEHKGTIEVTSEAGKGTTFKIYLPIRGFSQKTPGQITIIEGDEEKGRIPKFPKVF